MKTVMTWCGLSAAIILTGLLIRRAPAEHQGALLAGALLLTNGLLLVKVCIGSK